MAGTMTWVGMDVHARSTHAAAIDLVSGELSGCGSGRGWRRRSRGWPGCRVRCMRVMRRGRRGSGSIVPRLLRDRDACDGAGQDAAWGV